MPNALSNDAESKMSCKEWENVVIEKVKQPIDSKVLVLQKHTAKARIYLNLKKKTRINQ